LLALALALGALVSHALPAYACTPPPDYVPASIAQRTTNADIVVLGVVESVEVESPASHIATIQVEEILKGEVASTVVVDGYGPDSICRSPVKPDDRLMFFIDRDSEGKLHAHYEMQIDATAWPLPHSILRARIALGTAPRVLLPLAANSWP
jgi:hypothetical protein